MPAPRVTIAHVAAEAGVSSMTVSNVINARPGALGAIDAARTLGLRVPDDVSVVGFDDLPQAAHSAPPLTTVRQPLHDMGRAATRALLSLIASQPLAIDDIRLPAQLILRATTAPPRH